MSEVLQALRDSTDPLENDLAQVYAHWQEVKRNQGERAGLGYEPRDINAKGVIAVISGRVLNASVGFEEVDPKQSYEAIVLKYPERFTDDVIAAAQERLKLGASIAHLFHQQDVQFLIKSSSYKLFEQTNVATSAESWIGRNIKLPAALKEHDLIFDCLGNSFRSLVWINEKEDHGEKGKGLTALAQFGPMGTDGYAQIIDVIFFDVPFGKEFLKQHVTLKRMYEYSLARTWSISDSEVSDFLTAVRQKVHLFSQYTHEDPNPEDVLNLETIEDITALRQVVLRRYQGAFRKALLAQRPNCCAITGTSEVSVLEAAHLIPYAEKFADRDKPENGLLLRSDIHKLFDAHLISINPDTKRVEVSPDVKSLDYQAFFGKFIEDEVSRKSLHYHYSMFSQCKPESGPL